MSLEEKQNLPQLAEKNVQSKRNPSRLLGVELDLEGLARG